MKISPLYDRVLAERLEEELTSAGGIVIPDAAKEKPVRAKIISTGKGKLLDDGTIRPLDVKAGDEILFGKYAGTEVKFDGKEYLILREDDIIGIVH